MAEAWLFDTDVLIDYLRGRADAVSFVQNSKSTLRIASPTVAELYVGVREGRERDVLDNFISTFETIPVTVERAKQAGLWRRDYGKSHGTGRACSQPTQ